MILSKDLSERRSLSLLTGELKLTALILSLTPSAPLLQILIGISEIVSEQKLFVSNNFFPITIGFAVL